MNSELLKLKGRLADTEKQLEEIEMKAENYLISIRELLDPYNSFEELQLEKVFLLVKDFRDLQLQYRKLSKLKDNLKEDLGL